MKQFAIGIDLGGTNIAAGLVDLPSHAILQTVNMKTRAPRPVESIADDIAAEADELCRLQGISKDDVLWIGVATPGIVRDDLVLTASNLGWTNAPLGALIREKAGIRQTFLANDANAAALGEAQWGCGQGASSLVAVTLGTGIGGGIVFNHKIWEGFNGFAAEIGHMITEVGGRPCACGKNGCMETYFSATALIRDTKTAMEKHPESAMWKISPTLDAVGGKTAFIAAKEGDAAGKDVVGAFIESLAVGVSNVINILQPEILCIGGGISKEGDALMIPLRKRVQELSFGGENARTKVVAATLFNDAGIIGAALLGLQD